jgi:ubiquinone/menaquinone biosynthesis C-methylase UbiE
MTKIQDATTFIASYEMVAREYYDSERHPTCANFREASRIIFRQWLRSVRDKSQICEVGAGKSLVAEVLAENRRNWGSLTLVDESASMLHYSDGLKDARVRLVVASAFGLPFDPESFDVVASCLGDPYNVISFWTEVHRVLKPHGKCLFTTPSWEWATAFRDISDTSSMHSSVFELSDGSQISLPSHIYSEHDQIRHFGSACLTVSNVARVSIRELAEQRLSPKLVLCRGGDANVVTGYAATKSQQ